MNITPSIETTGGGPLQELPRWKFIGIAIGIYPFDWGLRIERFEKIMTTVSIGPLCITVHH